jgi:hypothetical protein
MTPIELLVEALRSGNYAQGRCELASKKFGDPDSRFCYCCLGVACDLYQRHVGDLPARISGNRKVYERYDDTHLPERVRKWLGFRSCGGELTAKVTFPQGHYDNLIDINDSGKFTFDQIADVIEAGHVAMEQAL